ncbi:MAG TPA: hypothetical protein VN416_03705 [Desulfomonilia bacterium]|jgi:hypothetical protein|nr:hypothetical protein [Desulfomonilia bacterium]
MKSMSMVFIAAVVLVSFQTTRADTLELKNGQILSGTYAGGTAGTVRFETAKGVQVYTTAEVLALTFTGQKAAAAPAAKEQAVKTQTAKPAPVSKPVSVTVPSGTTLLVRMADGASSHDEKGKRFTTTLDTDLAAGGVVIAKAGSRAYGRVENSQQAGRYAGQSLLDIRLTELTIDGKTVPIVTGPFAQAGARSGGKTAKGALVGTAVGAIADGSKGAAKGAAIGAVASGLKKGEAIVIPPGELLEFKLQQPLSVTVQKGK